MTSGLAGKYPTTLPPLTDYPTDMDWKALEPSLSAPALSFRNELHTSNLHVAWVIRDEIPEAGKTCVKEAGKCGYSAWKIAADLRSHYSLPKCDLRRDIVGTLKKEARQGSQSGGQ